MSKTEITITGMTCGHCEMSVTNAIATLEGVESVKVDHSSGTAVVTSSDITAVLLYTSPSPRDS